MANLQLPQNQLYEAVLGSEYCSGYIDSLGKWNTGFYCPSIEESVDVFCCGSATHKYCCTKKDQVVQTEVESLTVVIGVIVGAATALLLLTIVACVCFSWCPLYKKTNPSKSRASMYRMYNQGSDHSGVTNMYSVSRGTTPLPSHSTPATPPHHRDTLHLLNAGMSHSHTLPHSLSHHHSFRGGNSNKEEYERRYGTLGRQPREHPPPYHILPRSSYLLIPQDTPDLLSGGLMHEDAVMHRMGKRQQEEMEDMVMQQQQQQVSQAHHLEQHQQEQEEEEEDIYTSTKF